jgi:hypothetical protein
MPGQFPQKNPPHGILRARDAVGFGQFTEQTDGVGFWIGLGHGVLWEKWRRQRQCLADLRV